jgi:DNA-binding LacI/PurR family transcriptional regulator
VALTSKRVTLVDIARRAGVTKAAVSFALNGAPGVSPATRVRVQRIAAELGYQPNTAARALKRAQADAVGIVIDRPANLIGAEPFFMKLIAGVQSVLAERHVSLVFTLAQNEDEEIGVYRNWWAQSRVDGVLVVDVKSSDRRLAVLDELAMPAVVAGPSSSASGHSSVAFDDAGCMREVVEYLASRGHRRIGRVSGMVDLAHTRIRDDALRRVARSLGLSVQIVRGDYSSESGGRATRTLLAREPAPTAIIYDSDVMAVAGMRTIGQAGLLVPRDMSVVAWDDSVMCELAHPSITAVNRDIQGYGALLARRLLDLVQGNPTPEAVAPLTAGLVSRETTGLAPKRA